MLKTTKLIIVLAAGLAWIIPTTAQASWVLIAQEGVTTKRIPVSGTNPNTGATGTGLATFTIGDFTVTPTVVDYQDSGLADLSLTSLDLNNNAGSTKTLTLTLEDTAFTQPGAPSTGLEANSNVTEVSLVGTGTLKFQTFINGHSVTAGPQTLTHPGSDFSAPYFFFRGASFDVKNVTTITLSGGGRARLFEEGDSLVTPEPASLTLALTGLGFVAGYPLLRRRKPA
jgi:hypothetical protein